MSADDLHATCIREDQDADSPYPLDLTVGRRVHDGIEAITATPEWQEGLGGLDELCDEARDLVDYILAQPSPHARYATMVAVIGNLLSEALGLELVERTPPPTTPTPRSLRSPHGARSGLSRRAGRRLFQPMELASYEPAIGVDRSRCRGILWSGMTQCINTNRRLPGRERGDKAMRTQTQTTQEAK